MKISNSPARFLKVSAAAVLLLAVAAPAQAHHSFARFDHAKEVTLTGTLKEFQWTNPHVWLQVVGNDGANKGVEWSIEAASLNSLARKGWTRKSVAAGDKVEVVMNPARDGSKEGSLLRLKANGKAVGQPD